jgi:xanthine dehydrogenase accessory factor
VRELARTLAEWRAEGAQIGRAVVIRTFFSTPRPEGSVLIATADGRLEGSVSGGCVEGAVVEEIRGAISNGLARVVRYGISDEQAWDVGLACGGIIDVLVEPNVPAPAEAAARGTGREGVAVIAQLPGDTPGADPAARAMGRPEPPRPPLVVRADGGMDGTLGDTEADRYLSSLALGSLAQGTSRTVEVGGRMLFIEAFPPRRRVVIVGAGQVAVPLVPMMRALDYDVVVVDGRAAFATRERFPLADRIVVAWPDEAAAALDLGPDDAVVILSHDPKFDDPAATVALARGCRYVGVIGSRKRQAERREHLAAAGVAPVDLARIHGPIGLDLGGRSPAETALAIAAELVSSRFGGTGRTLTDKWLEAMALDGAATGEAAAAAEPATGHGPAAPGPAANGGSR